jgi:YegS/Rv2252/BmrU family lipid kinase
MSAKKGNHVILNPTAGGGRAGRMASKIMEGMRRRFGGDVALHVTRRPLDATGIAKRAVQEGAQRIVAVGGDGTLNETVNGFLDKGKWINPSCELGVVDCGTGKGFAQSLKLPKTLCGQLDLIQRGRCTAVDVGMAILRNERGEKVERLFISECQVGIGGAVVDRVECMSKRLGGTAAFGLAALMTALRHRSSPVTVSFDGHGTATHDLLGLAIGNGSCCGGGMRLTPRANPADGRFDVLLIHGMGIYDRLIHFPKIYSGRHVDSRRFTVELCRHIRIAASNPLSVAADGERLGETPCEVAILPAALKVIAVQERGMQDDRLY